VVRYCYVTGGIRASFQISRSTGVYVATVFFKSFRTESTPARFCVFLSDPDPQSKICEKQDLDPGSIFNFGSSRNLCGHFLGKIICELRLDGWLQPESQQESDSQIWRIAGPGFKNFATVAESESEKVTPATSAAEMITIRFAGWISDRIVSLQPGTDIQKLLSNGNRLRIRIPERFSRYFEDTDFWKKLHNHSFSIFGSTFSAFCAMTPSLTMVYALYGSVIPFPSIC